MEFTQHQLSSITAEHHLTPTTPTTPYATKAESNGCEVHSPTGLKPAPSTSYFDVSQNLKS